MTEKEIYERLKEQFPESVLEFQEEVLQPFIVIKPEDMEKVAYFLRDDERLKFESLINLSSVDMNENLAVVYHLYSMTHRHMITLKAFTPRENPHVASVAWVWRTADWHEREAYDLMGIIFDGHPDLRRILLPEDWEGHPLRKDYVTPEYYNGLRIPYPQENGDLQDEE